MYVSKTVTLLHHASSGRELCDPLPYCIHCRENLGTDENAILLEAFGKKNFAKATLLLLQPEVCYALASIKHDRHKPYPRVLCMQITLVLVYLGDTKITCDYCQVLKTYNSAQNQIYSNQCLQSVTVRTEFVQYIQKSDNCKQRQKVTTTRITKASNLP